MTQLLLLGWNKAHQKAKYIQFGGNSIRMICFYYTHHGTTMIPPPKTMESHAVQEIVLRTWCGRITVIIVGLNGRGVRKGQ